MRSSNQKGLNLMIIVYYYNYAIVYVKQYSRAREFDGGNVQ